MTDEHAPLSGESTISAWRAHPVGGRIIAGIAEQAGMDEQALTVMRNIPLSRLLSANGAPPEGRLDSLVAQAAAVPAATDPGLIGWVEQITPGRFVAGLLDDFSPIHEVSDAVLERVFNVNVFGLIRRTRAVLPLMRARRQGSIVNIASEAALRGYSTGLAYTASKTAVIGVTRSTAFMYEQHGIRVNAVVSSTTPPRVGCDRARTRRAAVSCSIAVTPTGVNGVRWRRARTA